MSDQYTPTIISAQAYLATLHQDTITRQDQELVRLRQEVFRLRSVNAVLSNQIRDLELDLTMTGPRQGIRSLKGLSKTQQVEQLASDLGVSVSTIWRRVQSGKVVLED